MSDNARKHVPKAQAPKAQAYARVVEDATLENIRLVSSSFKISPKFREDDHEVKRFIDQEVKGVDFDQAAGALVGMVRCRCWMGSDPKTGTGSTEVSSETDPQKASLLTINAQYVLLFKISGEHGSDSIATFFHRVGPISVWPYFRAHVAAIAAEGNVDIPVLPIKRLVHRVKAAENYVDPDDKSDK